MDTKTWPHPTAQSLRPNNQQGGNTAHLSPDGLYKLHLRQEPPLDTPLDTALPTRGTRHSSAHQCTGTSASNQEACTSLLDQTHPLGGKYQKQEELQSCGLQKGDHKHRELDKMRCQRNMFQKKVQDKNPEEILSEVEMSNLPEKEFRVMIVKMIQNIRKRMEA